MKIFPAIDIKDKKCVRLVKGDFDNKIEYEMYPIAVGLPATVPCSLSMRPVCLCVCAC